MAFKFMPESKAPSSKSLDHIALEIENLDTAQNIFTGTNIETGEEMSIRMASVDEMSRYYAPRRLKTEAERDAWAESQIQGQPSAKDQKRKGDIGGIIQMQNVRELNSGEHIARWNNYLTTSPENQVGMTAQVEILHIDRKNKDGEPFNRRDAKAILVDEAFPMEDPSAAAKVENLLSHNSHRELPMNFKAKTSALVVMSIEGDDEMRYGRVFAEWDKEAKSAIYGAEHNITKASTNANEALGQTALAASMSIPFERLQLEKSGLDRDFAQALYQAVQEGEVQVSVAPQIQGNVMPMLDGKLMDKIKDPDSLIHRGYFEAHVGMEEGRVNPETNDRFDASFRQILDTAYTPSKHEPDFLPREVKQVVAAVADTADAKRQALTKPQAEKEQTQEEEASFGASMGM